MKRCIVPGCRRARRGPEWAVCDACFARLARSTPMPPTGRAGDVPTFGSLFAGIGGIDLGLERAGWECRFQVEWDAYCQRILDRHWPDVPRYGDIHDVHGAGHCVVADTGYPDRSRRNEDAEGTLGAAWAESPSRRCDRCLPQVDLLAGGSWGSRSGGPTASTWQRGRTANPGMDRPTHHRSGSAGGSVMAHREPTVAEIIVAGMCLSIIIFAAYIAFVAVVP